MKEINIVNVAELFYGRNPFPDKVTGEFKKVTKPKADIEHARLIVREHFTELDGHSREREV